MLNKEYTNENIIQPGSSKKVSTQQLCCELELEFAKPKAKRNQNRYKI